MLQIKRWYLVQCKPHESFRAALNLNNQGYVCFHPTYPIQRKVAGTVRSVITPLFPHYLFVLLDGKDNWSKIRSTRGVAKIVSFNGEPATLKTEIVEQLQQHCLRLNGQAPVSLLKPGDTVIITDGCFKELEAIVKANTPDERVILLLQLFNRQQEIALSVHAVKICA